MKFTIPQVSIEKLKSQTISASVNGTPVPPETYTQAGQFAFSRDVPASVLGGDVARVDFSLDKAVPPGTADRRELGVVATTIGFQAK